MLRAERGTAGPGMSMLAWPNVCESRSATDVTSCPLGGSHPRCALKLRLVHGCPGRELNRRAEARPRMNDFLREGAPRRIDTPDTSSHNQNVRDGRSSENSLAVVTTMQRWKRKQICIAPHAFAGAGCFYGVSASWAARIRLIDLALPRSSSRLCPLAI